MKAKSQNTQGCPNGTSSTCITWAGDNIPELGICYGQSITDVEFAIAQKLVDISKSLDFKTFDLSCLIDKPSLAESDKNIRIILELLYDNQCTLKQLIDGVSGTGSLVTNLNMRCLKKFDDFNNEIPQDYNQSLQSVINQVCTNVTNIALLQNKTEDLQDQIDNLTPPTPYTEPTIVTCVTPTPRLLSAAVPLVAQDLCNYKEKVGPVIDIQQAMARQCPDLNQLLGTADGWILNPQNQAQTINNLWITVCNLLGRVNVIENTCCKITCTDVKLGFDVITNADSDAVILKFTSQAGTEIPNGFVDCGSTLTITDIDKNYVTYPLEISNGSVSAEFDVSGLNLSGVLNISVTAKLCTEGLTCEKCVGKLYKIDGGACPVCAINVSGKTGSVTIVYKTTV